jgi:Holliday junction DNA helicase RuvA
MIARLSGQIVHRGERYIILDVNGVGYKLFVSTETLKSPPNSFWTYLAVREDALDLYGFRERSELEFFELLIGVSGIGPRSALAILSLAPPEVLTRAISAGDSSYLTKVSGIGQKSAAKIILELRDKVGALDTGADLKEEGDAIEALQALGYNLKEARDALRRVTPETSATGDKIKAALKILGNHHGQN